MRFYGALLYLRFGALSVYGIWRLRDDTLAFGRWMGLGWGYGQELQMYDIELTMTMRAQRVMKPPVIAIVIHDYLH